MKKSTKNGAKVFDRAFLKRLRDEIDAALAPIAEEYGITLQLGNASFSPDDVTFKLKGHIIRAPGEMSREAADYKKYAGDYGLNPNQYALGAKFRHRNSTFEITGLKMSSRKYPVLCRNHNGKTYKFPVDLVKRCMGSRLGKFI
jgi:hypothetical protein